jgi:NAD(P)-dependent dehydrogenase (short-subunit alcohol dehydrogenase family)
VKALVTGVTRGLGRALVDHLVAGGWDVAAVGRNDPRVRTLRQVPAYEGDPSQ